MAKKHVNRPLWHPALWPIWFVVFLLRLISLLSLSTKQKLGEKLARLTMKVMPARYQVTQRNIQVCLPELSQEQQNALVEKVFIAIAQGFLESTHAWWRNMQPYIDTLIITGKENLLEARAKGKGVLILGGHFSILDFALPLMDGIIDKLGYMYRPNGNPVMDRMIIKGRSRYDSVVSFNKQELKEMIEFLQSGGCAWYACDQDFGKRSKVFAPFFKEPAACITTPSWIAQESGSPVIFLSQFRHPNGQFELCFSPIFDGFGEDEQKDAECWNHCLEQEIRKHPEQYFWLHKRFKKRPEGHSSIY